MRKARTEQEDLKFLELLVDHDIKDIGREFGISYSAAHSWLRRLRKKIVVMQIFLNKVRTFQRISPRVRKLTTIGSIPEIDEDTGEEEYPELKT